MIEPICIGCGQRPAAIPEYAIEAAALSISPDHYVATEEGTYNRWNGHFACTDCYIKMGEPARPAPQRWVAP